MELIRQNLIWGRNLMLLELNTVRLRIILRNRGQLIPSSANSVESTGVMLLILNIQSLYNYR